MLDIKFVRENPDKVKEGIKKKGYDPKIVDQVLTYDLRWRHFQSQFERLQAQHKKESRKGGVSQELATGKKKIFTLEGRDISQKISKRLKKKIKIYKTTAKRAKKERDEKLLELPNLPAEDVPPGKDESDNEPRNQQGKPRKFNFPIRDYQELGELLDIIDVKRASKVSGSRFGYLKNEAVQLEFALVQFAIETLIKEGFIPVVPPVMIKNEMMRGMGYFEAGGQENMYLLDKDNLVLVGTAEQSIGPMHAGEIFEAKDLPRRYVGFSTCFRREAGSYGKDTRGIFRVHQFDKVEMFSFIKPQKDADKREHEYLLSLEEKLVQALKIPYQVTKMCTGDLGHPAARKYDINCWFPSEKRYRETHSVSTCTDFQARRLNIRYREKGKIDFVHTLNGTAFAIGRTILAILENYQQKDGSVLVPEVLQKYTGFKKITPKK